MCEQTRSALKHTIYIFMAKNKLLKNKLSDKKEGLLAEIFIFLLTSSHRQAGGQHQRILLDPHLVPDQVPWT